MKRKRTKPQGTYRFRDKDPIIYVLKTGIQDWADRRGIKFSKAMSEVAEIAGVTTSCLYKWFFGSTVRPQNSKTLAVGLALELPAFVNFANAITKNVGTRKLRVVLGG